MAKNWTSSEENTLRKMIADKMPIEKIARYLNKSENSVYLKAYRLRIPLKDMCRRPTMRMMIEAKFGDVTILQVHRNFYEKTRISQKRWPKLLYGYEEPTQDEVEAVAAFFNMTHNEWVRFYNVVQLSLDFSSNEQL